jgi:eukaryotic-like serine/threonine-protein kinase
MALRSRVFGVGKLFVIVGALAATYVLFLAASMRLALRAREVQVPDFASRTASEATALASDLGLAIKVDPAPRIDAKVAAGQVVTQDPPAGTMTRQQRSVRVWLSEGARAARLPSLGGQTERSAQLRIAQDGLELVAVSEVRTDAFPPDVVVAQDPAPNSLGTKVALLINRGEQAANYVMPDLIGINGERVAAVLRNHGLRVAVVGSAPYPGVAAGVVVRQRPQAGFQIAPGEAVSLEVSR